MSQLHGNVTGLSVLERRSLERLGHQRVGPSELCSDALAVRLCDLAERLGRQVGVLIDRTGLVTHALVGDDHQLMLPDLGRWGKDSGRLRGLRLVHVHLKGEPVDADDLNDLARLGLDLVAALTQQSGLPQLVSIAHLATERQAAPYLSVEPTAVLPQQRWDALQFDCTAFVAELESHLARVRPAGRLVDARARAVLVHVGPDAIAEAEDRLDELEELARTAHVEVVARVIQRRRDIDKRTLIGSGKLAEITLKALQADATALIFDRELTPSQSKSIANQAELKVLDRTQLILDIFARRARSQDGKLQVELAQLRYSLPRLGDRDNALSRLAGGIGGVGPGETKLEIDRRRARDRIHRIEDELERLKRGRGVRRAQRSEVPSIALVGYTNVGKSSVLNALAKSDAYTENLLFATLDPTTRRLHLPSGAQVVITDTVGFIRDLPKELLGAFEATLEEVHAADLVVVVVDAAHRQMERQLASVLKILADHDLGDAPRRVLVNKCDAVTDPAALRDVVGLYDAWQVSAKTRSGIADLLIELEPAVAQARQRAAEQEQQAQSERDEERARGWSPV
ncbi:MAG: GTPase HflX [Deltaproteobacteria bacterium]|nr:GTPase HflX [Deltaproteobacteria bacterium]